MSGTVPGAGWYPDAVDPGLIRWWDGVAWSDHTQAAPRSEPEPFAVAAPITATVPVPPGLSPVPPPFAEPAAAAPAAAPAPAAAAATPAATTPAPVAAAAVAAPIASPYDAPLGASTSAPVSTAFSAPVSAPISASSAPGLTSFPLSGPVRLSPPTQSTQSAPTPVHSASGFAAPAAGSVPLDSVDYEPMERSWGSSRVTTTNRSIVGWSTGGAWMLALTPLVHLGLAVLTWLLTDGGTSAVAAVVVASTGGVAVLWPVVGAIADFRRLGSLGHEFRPSVLWVLAGPFFYLLVRSVHLLRTCGRGVAPTWVFVSLAIVVTAAGGLLGLMVPREATTAELRQVEATIARDLQEQGLSYSVLCPDIAPGELGATFVCTAYDGSDPAAVLRVRWTGLPGTFSFEIESS